MRNGYVKPSEIIIRERITPEIQNAICSCFDELHEHFSEKVRDYSYDRDGYFEMEKYLWTYFLNRRESDICVRRGYQNVATAVITDDTVEWFKKLDLIEDAINFVHEFESRQNIAVPVYTSFARRLNLEFERLNFAYRVINDRIVEITSRIEIDTIEHTLEESNKNIKTHIEQALKFYSHKPIGDYRNSIKESISAVEAYCRERTNENTLGKALKKLESNGILIPNTLKVAFEKLYDYTNLQDTGIRHALMDTDGNYIPKAEEALFMLVTCSAFINYLRMK